MNLKETAIILCRNWTRLNQAHEFKVKNNYYYYSRYVELCNLRFIIKTSWLHFVYRYVRLNTRKQNTVRLVQFIAYLIA